MPLTTWIGLLICNLIWSINPAIAKLIVEEIGPEHTAWLKYTVAFVSYLLARLFLNSKNHKTAMRPSLPIFLPISPAPSLASSLTLMPKKLTKDLLVVILIGFLTCFVSPLAQMLGLQASSAVNNAILVTIEPVFAVIFGWLIFGERLYAAHYYSFLLAIVGFASLTHMIPGFLMNQRPSSPSVAFGDCMLLISIACEGMYTVLGRHFSKTYSPSQIFGTAMLVGVVLLTLVILPWKGLPPFGSLSTVGWIAVFWLGAIGTAMTYLYWLHALSQSLSLGSVVLTLFLQPVLGSLTAVFFLGESVDLGKLLGGLMIVVAVGIQFASESRLALRTSQTQS